MAELTEREKVKALMEFLNTGIQVPPDVAIVFKEIFVLYRCGCHGEVQCIPITKDRTIKLLLYCFCQNCKICSAVPTKLILYKTELEYGEMCKKKISQNPVYRTILSYEQFAKYYELN